MELALLTLDFTPDLGGVQSYLHEVVVRVGREHRVTVLTPVDGSPEEAPFRRIHVPDAGVTAFARALRSVRPARVLVGHAHPRLLIPAAVAAWGRYATLTHGNDYLAAQGRWHRPLFNGLLGRSRPLITTTRANAERLGRLGLPGAVVIPPGTDPERFSPPVTPPPPPLRLLTVGRLIHRKGVDTVLEALPSLRGDFPDLHYRVVGDGPERPRLERMARDLGIEHAVEFLGRASEGELPRLYRRAHVFVMPAREVGGSGVSDPSGAAGAGVEGARKEDRSTEGFGIVYLEAGASGLPVVAGRSGGVREAVLDGETGLLVPPDDPEALARALRALLADPGLRARLGRAARRRVEEEMTWDHTTEALLEALEGAGRVP